MSVVVVEAIERRIVMVGTGDGPDTAFGELDIIVEEVEIGLAINLDIGQLA